MSRSAVGFHHLSRTGGAALVRRMYELGPSQPWTLTGLDATTGGEELRKAINNVPSGNNVIFHSHSAFGVHRFIDFKTTYFTVLREPVARTISQFYWIFGFELRDLDNDKLFAKLNDFVDSFENLNHQAYELAFCAQDRILHDALLNTQNLTGTGDSYLLKALQNLQKYFDFVGRTEEPEKTHQYLEETFGFSGLEFAGQGFANASLAAIKHGPNRNENVPASILTKINNKTYIDKYLYENCGYVKAHSLPSGLIIGSPRFTKQQKKYSARVGETWHYFIEGLLGLGANISAGKGGSRGSDYNWQMAFTVPLAAPCTTDLNCKILMTAATIGAKPLRMRVDISIGSAGYGSIEFGNAAANTDNQYEAYINIIVPEVESLIHGLDFKFEAVMLDPEDDDDKVVSSNPLPYMLQSFFLSEVTQIPIGVDMPVAPGSDAHKMLTDGFATPQVEGFAWSMRRTARISMRVEKAALLSLNRYRNGSKNLFAVLQLSVVPLIAPGRSEGQTVICSINRCLKSNIYVNGQQTICLLIDFADSAYASGLIAMDLEFPNAVPLGAVIDHPDHINPHAIMLHGIRILPLLSMNMSAAMTYAEAPDD
jgi:hypothetical protein